MDTENNMVDFGFTRAVVPAGAHVCQIFEDDQERSDAFLRFPLKGLELRELCAGFPDVIGEMSPTVQDMDGGDRLLEYEARVNVFLRDVPVPRA